MYRWQVSLHDYYSNLAKSQYVEDLRLPTSRGVIYAADGTYLAVDDPVWGVYATLSTDEEERDRFNENRDEFITSVSSVLDMKESDVDKLLSDDFVYVPLKHNVSSEDKKALEEMNLFGIYFKEEEQRIYPHGNLACHILGFVGKNEDGEDVGQYGLEGYYAGDLLGQEGFKYEEKDSRGNVILTGEYDPVIPREGKSIVLTIMPGLQMRVEESLEKSVKEFGAKSGSAIILDPDTGAILAMANYPNYDPNYYWKADSADVYRNKAISDVYEYGSVNKVLTVAAALEENLITKDSYCYDETGSIKVIDKTIYTWDMQPDGAQQPKDVLANSNNVCAVRFGLLVGSDKYHDYLSAFGIGDFIGIGLEEESTSYLKPANEWNQVDLAAASFGQSISATPLQVISAISTIANDGERMRPYIVSKLYDDEETITIEPESFGQIVSEETAYEVQDMMSNVVTNGEAKYWFTPINNYEIAGKTGTAQIPLPDAYGYYEDKTNVTFVGFTPIHGAKMIMLVRLEEPTTNTLSAYTVVPAWVDMFQNVVVELGIAPKDQ